MRKDIINLTIKKNRKSIKRDRNNNDFFKIKDYVYNKMRYYKWNYFEALIKKGAKKNVIKFKNKCKTLNKF